MKPLSYRQEDGCVIITVEFDDDLQYDETQRDLRIDGDNVLTLLQSALCAVKFSGDDEQRELARKITRAWCP